MRLPETGKGKGGNRNGKVAVFVRIPMDLLEKLDTLAQVERRTRSNALGAVVERYFKSTETAVARATSSPLKGKA